MNYQSLYRQSLEKPEEFWAEAASDLVWDKPWEKVLDDSDIPFYEWFSGGEINTCNSFLVNELKTLPEHSVVMALGGIAHRAIVKALGLRQADYKFGHAALHDLGQFRLLDSYHCSRYNTNTRRLTPDMFEAVFAEARQLLDS